MNTISEMFDGLARKLPVLVVNVDSFSSLPKRYPSSGTDSEITDDLVLLNSVLSNPSAQTADWTVTTSNGYLTISGTNAISGSTSAKLYLMKERP